ncbi:protein lin-54 homolog [Pseudochaenichthys georgianus]|uniref:protein lin-54 homolog n=1 Tax=Pseudochaenichthys georgianus TaxID=52239 RepID=UPI00146ACCFE|nr:protein lin-54 homolog [Pseudochaenichthys georgianus]XP_033951460.1 protein lin-54 homolog [Pseudochaenichthys georgianus]XP_033951461.1 protein lin-54 homolog [Pseudochaenichthys georgianus]XP_033951462.1 protein lin-54 homolog [Pseudochaenichthys georgianus]
MDVVSPELNSLLPDEIMDTEAIEDIPHSQPGGGTMVQSASDDAPLPMETDTPMASENVRLCSIATSTGHTQALTTSTASNSTFIISSGSQLPMSISSSSPSLLTFKPAMATCIATTKTTDSLTGTTFSTSGLQKLTAPFTISAASHQIILNKVASEAAKSAGGPPQIIKQEGQKLLVTAIGKSGQPIVLQLPHTGSKPGLSQTSGDLKSQAPQFKVVTIGGRTELKPILGSPGNQLTTLQAQQLKTMQIAKKTPVSSAAPIKFIITKTVNSKGLSPQTSVTPVIAGRVLTQSSLGMPSRTITLSEPHNTTTLQSITGKKIAISPLKSPSKVTVVSVASPTSNASHKSVTLPVNVSLGQQILTVQQSTPGSPIKVTTSQTTQGLKPGQTVTVGGVGGSQFKTIIPLATQPNVQQIQVPGSRFHYVRLVTATTASSSGQPSGPSTSSLQNAKPMMVSTGAVRMSVPIVPAQSIKQMVPKSLTSAAIVTTTQTQQRLIMPATPLPQIQPNFTNLPPGTVLAPAPGGGNMGYAVVPAQYVTQLQQSPFVTLASSSAFTTNTGIQTQARLPLNGLSAAETTSRPRKPCNCTKSQCLKLYCDCFANGEFCSNCNCNNCFNNLEHETERLKAIKTCLDRNPEAFKPKIGKGKEGESDRRHSKGCNCKRSGCLKNYCECYEAKIMCSSICKCIGCKNFEESPERKTLMHLADAADMRVQQQTAAKTKLSSQISDLLMRTTPVMSSGSGRLPFTFVTKEVLEATCECLLEQAKKAEQTHQPQVEAERMILEEFGHCLMRIISSAGKAKADCASINC